MFGGFPELHVFKDFYSCLTGAPDNRGTEFVIGYMENNGVSINVELFVTTSRTTKVSVTVDSPKCTSPRVSSSFTVTAGQVKQLFISPSIRYPPPPRNPKLSPPLITSSDNFPPPLKDMQFNIFFYQAVKERSFKRNFIIFFFVIIIFFSRKK